MATTTDQPEGTEMTYRLDEQVGYILRLVTQRHTSIFQEQAQQLVPGGLTPTQFSALLRVYAAGSCSQNRLGRMAAMDVATIKGVVDRLLRKGLVSVVPDPDDRRRTKISLTSAGEALIPALFETGAEISGLTLAPLSEDEAKQLVTLLGKLT